MLLITSLTASAGEVAQMAKKDAKTDAPKELKNQTNCPVMGGVIDSSIYTDIQGQRVYHCCPMCSAKLKKDPDSYFKKAGELGILFENIQTTCPVSGKELKDKSVYTDFEGRRIIFCSKKDRGTFNENPQKFLSDMDAPHKMDTPHMMKMDSSGHDSTGNKGHSH